MLCRHICRHIYPLCRHIHLDLPQYLYIYAAIYIFYADIYILICRNLYIFMPQYIYVMPAVMYVRRYILYVDILSDMPHDLPQSLFMYAATTTINLLQDLPQYIYVMPSCMSQDIFFMSTYIYVMPQDLPQCLFMYAAITVINLSQDMPQVLNSSCRKLPQTACGRLKSISVGVHNSSSQDLPQTTSNQHMY